MTDIASLGIKVDTSALSDLKQAGLESVDTARKVGSAWDEATSKTGSGAKTAATSVNTLAKAERESASGVKVGTQAIKDQQQSLRNLISQIDPVVGAMQRLDAQQKELAAHRAAGLINESDFTRYNTQLEQTRASIGKVGVTSKQTAFALRQLPAQFSDIFISLQGGQRPLSVLLQQGSQIKDSFGGVSIALRETGKFALKMVNPFTVLAAAGIALAVAYNQGASEADEYNKAIALTGNYVGLTSRQLTDMAASVSKAVGTQHEASGVLSQLASTGRFAADQLQLLSTSAIAMEHATGQAIEETIAQYVRLADSPTSAILEINKSQHLLTLSIYEQIHALEEEGRQADAARLALKLVSEEGIKRADEIKQNLGTIESAWNSVKETATKAWDVMLGIGRQDSLKDLEARIQKIQKALNGGGINGTQRIGLESQLSALQAKLAEEKTKQAEAAEKSATTKIQDNAVQAAKRLDDLGKEVETNAEKRKKALAQLARDIAAIKLANPNDARIAPDNVDKLKADINEKFKDPAAKKFQDDAATRALQSLRAQEATLAEQLGTTQKLTEAQRERAKFESLIADLKDKKTLTADQKSLLASQDAIKAQLDKNVALAEEVRLRDETNKLAAYQVTLSKETDQLKKRTDAQVSSVGIGREQYQRMQELLALQNQFTQKQASLQEQFNKGEISQGQYDKQTEALRKATADQTRIVKDGFDRMDRARGDWFNGMAQAFDDFAAKAKDTASQASELISSTMETVSRGIGDTVAQSIIYGDNWRDSLRSVALTITTDVISALAEMAARQAINYALELTGVNTVKTAKITAAGEVSGAQIGAISATAAAANTATTASVGTQTAAAAETTAAWTPAATAASIGSYGTAAAVGLAAVIAAIALAKGGFRKGGYTGDYGASEVAGVVHGKEYVFDAEATQRIGVANLERLRAGREMVSKSNQQSSEYLGRQWAPRGNTVVNQNIQVSGRPDTRTAKQIAAETQRKQNIAVARYR